MRCLADGAFGRNGVRLEWIRSPREEAQENYEHLTMCSTSTHSCCKQHNTYCNITVLNSTV